MNKTTSFCSVRVESDAVVYSEEEKELWRVRIKDIRAIGEYTNDNGPFLDDYFFVLLVDNPNQWHIISFYAEGRDLFLIHLGRHLGHELQTGLCNSTEFKSRGLWPKDIEGQPFFNFVPEAKAKKVFGKIRQAVVPKVFFELAEPVRKLIPK